MPIKIAHIINPVNAESGSRFHFSQQVTYRTMQVARDWVDPDMDIEFLSVQYPEDHSIIPSGFKLTPNLDRSVIDIGSFQKPRKLPFLDDILTIAYDNSQAEYFIYTNVDIGLMPYFYQTVATYIRQGYDAFTINRRTISNTYQTLPSIPLMYADLGEPHRGWDCFVFQRQAIRNFVLGTICVGIPLVGLAFISNLIAFSRNFTQFTQEHLTFHLGNDRSWHKSPFADYAQHNQRQVLEILGVLDTQCGGFPRKSPPGRYLFFHQNPVISRIYESLMKIYIPAKITRKAR